MSYSQIGQDSWVLDILQNKKHGTFIDLGAGHPVRLNNTFLLESIYNWTGISYDIGPPYAHGVDRSLSAKEYIKFWNDHRSTPIIVTDLLMHDLRQSFNDYHMPKNIDYLSIDLEPPTSTYRVLYNLPLDQYQFKVITFEHDSYRGYSSQSHAAIMYMQDHGYRLERTQEQDHFFIFDR